MNIVITGGAGFLGQRLAALHGSCPLAFDTLILADITPPPAPLPDTRLQCLALDLSQPGAAERLIDADCGVLFHLAAIVSSHAESDFDLGMQVNFDATRQLLKRRAPGAGHEVHLHQFAGGVRRRVAAGDRRSLCGHPAILLRRAEGDVRATDQRLCAQRLRRWPRAAPAHHQRAAGQAEQGGIVVRQRHHPRAAAR